MNEFWALKAIKEGTITKHGVTYLILPNPTGSCDNCYFYTNRPTCMDNNNRWAMTICCSHGGQILKLKE